MNDLGRKAMALRDLRALLQMTPMPYWGTRSQTAVLGLLYRAEDELA